MCMVHDPCDTVRGDAVGAGHSTDWLNSTAGLMLCEGFVCEALGDEVVHAL